MNKLLEHVDDQRPLVLHVRRERLPPRPGARSGRHGWRAGGRNGGGERDWKGSEVEEGRRRRLEREREMGSRSCLYTGRGRLGI
ncbi:Os12g0110951 [Oryza sativa Japonica Group]|uniref:Os12g0110951 protein n=1 Tax=Oryza sativa subsp. japonica TaxID=39947 RepID=A0A0P0Y668_ORYSJ|nr:Os12g0110951 [Oryza sativa Japonica Group]